MPEEQGSIYKSLEYLDLRIGESKSIKTLDHFHLYCFDREKQHKHSLYSEETQLNTLVDLCLLTQKNLKSIKEDQNHFLSKIVQSLINKNKRLDTIVDLNKAILQKLDCINNNLDFIKSNLDLSYLSNIPSKSDIRDLVGNILSKPKEIEHETVSLIRNLEKNLSVLYPKINHLKEKIDILTQ